MIETRDPSGKFGIWREPDGGFRLEFYRPDGLLTSRTVFDAEAAREFLAAIADVIQEGESRGHVCPAARVDDPAEAVERVRTLAKHYDGVLAERGTDTAARIRAALTPLAGRHDGCGHCKAEGDR